MGSPVLPSDADAAAPSVFANLCAGFKSLFAVGRLFRTLINWMFTSTGELSAAFIALIPFPPPPTPAAAVVRVGIPTMVVDTVQGSKTFTVPANVYALDVEVVGAGGGGKQTAANGNVGGGGGGYARKMIAVTPGQMLPYVVGLGGVVGDPGGDGNPSSFNTTLIGLGGKGGDAVPALATIYGGGYSGADIGSEGHNGGSRWMGDLIRAADGDVQTNFMLFLGGKSGHPLSKTVGPLGSTLGHGGASAQAAGAGALANPSIPTAGANGAVIITYNTWTVIP